MAMALHLKHFTSGGTQLLNCSTQLFHWFSSCHSSDEFVILSSNIQDTLPAAGSLNQYLLLGCWWRAIVHAWDFSFLSQMIWGFLLDKSCQPSQLCFNQSIIQLLQSFLPIYLPSSEHLKCSHVFTFKELLLQLLQNIRIYIQVDSNVVPLTGWLVCQFLEECLSQVISFQLQDIGWDLHDKEYSQLGAKTHFIYITEKSQKHDMSCLQKCSQPDVAVEPGRAGPLREWRQRQRWRLKLCSLLPCPGLQVSPAVPRQ